MENVGIDFLQLGRAKLLIVDDQPLNIKMLHQAFAADYDIFMATSGEQALTLCARLLPDLILLDIEMPHMDGIEVCRRLKSMRATQDIPVIFVTAHNDEQAETLGLEVGAVDFISKPINRNTVRARVKTHLTLKIQSDLLRHWVYRDGLTDVYNRRYFDEQLNTEWNRAVRHHSALSLLMIDVDHFKLYNDHYGHQAGDDCLRQVAAAIQATLQRPGDMVARYGGEEFVCLLPETEQAGALHVANDICEQVKALALDHSSSPVMPCVTVSIGICCRKAEPYSEFLKANDLVKQADIQLYQAKHSGRNRACMQALDATLADLANEAGSGLTQEPNINPNSRFHS